MRAALLLIGLTACHFDQGFPGEMKDGGGSGGSDGGSGSGTGDGGGTGDGPGCAWSYMPTNFDPCTLPPPVPLTVSGTGNLDTSSTTLPKKVITQSDGSMITVIHLSQFTVEAFRTLTVNGTGVVFAVDGPVEVHGTIVIVGGNDNQAQCESMRGMPGVDSANSSSGGGGGGGGAAAENGGNGGSGDGSQAGSGGARGNKIASTLSPLRAGCRGGNGGRWNGLNAPGIGGRGGGALQISTNARIELNGFIDGSGRGGGGGPAAQVGAGGGGSGGGIFLEGPSIDLNFASRICADGGSGGEGGGAAAAGATGQNGRCNGIDPAQTTPTAGSVAGTGGDGGYAFGRTGDPGGSATGGGAGGGGGGGGVGWIRVKSPDLNNNGSIVTPAYMN